MSPGVMAFPTIMFPNFSNFVVYLHLRTDYCVVTAISFLRYSFVITS